MHVVKLKLNAWLAVMFLIMITFFQYVETDNLCNMSHYMCLCSCYAFVKISVPALKKALLNAVVELKYVINNQ